MKLVTQRGLSHAEVGRRLHVLPKLIKAWEGTYWAGKLIVGAQLKGPSSIYFTPTMYKKPTNNSSLALFNPLNFFTGRHQPIGARRSRHASPAGKLDAACGGAG